MNRKTIRQGKFNWKKIEEEGSDAMWYIHQHSIISVDHLGKVSSIPTSSQLFSLATEYNHIKSTKSTKKNLAS